MDSEKKNFNAHSIVLYYSDVYFVREFKDDYAVCIPWPKHLEASEAGVRRFTSEKGGKGLEEIFKTPYILIYPQFVSRVIFAW